MKRTIKIESCSDECPFCEWGEVYDCQHPYWEDKNVYENRIIRDEIPEKCPLRNEPLTITYKLSKQ